MPQFTGYPLPGVPVKLDLTVWEYTTPSITFTCEHGVDTYAPTIDCVKSVSAGHTKDNYKNCIIGSGGIMIGWGLTRHLPHLQIFNEKGSLLIEKGTADFTEWSLDQGMSTGLTYDLSRIFLYLTLAEVRKLTKNCTYAIDLVFRGDPANPPSSTYPVDTFPLIRGDLTLKGFTKNASYS